jgi:hypothetical protein
MKRLYHHQRKISLFAVLLLISIGIFFGIKTFSTSLSPQAPLPSQNTQSFAQLASTFTSIKT